MEQYISCLFPTVWLALPTFYFGCLLVRIKEGDKQRFNINEAISTFYNSCILGFLWSFQPIMKFLIDENKMEMTPIEFIIKLIFIVFIMDSCFYWIHRAMHYYKPLQCYHKKHHLLGIKHTCWGGLDENIEETFVIFCYLNAPYLFISVTKEFYLVYILVGSFQTAIMHGLDNFYFNLPPYPLVGGKFHNEHHKHPNKNFSGATQFWDIFMNTKKVY
eukprot:509529_1